MNNKFVIRLSLLCLAGFIAACALHKKIEITAIPGLSKSTVHNWLVDKDATGETAALFYNLKVSSVKQVMFGHMEDNKNGYDGWRNTPGRSDVYEVTGAYPAMYGFDFGGIGSFRPDSLLEKERQVSHDRVIEAYKRKGIVTFSWHFSNPVSKGSFYWKNSPVNAVSEILPGGKYNPVFNECLTKIARFAASVKYKGKLVPIIFRPFHEFDGDWFWWGKTHCTTEDYKALYRYTVTYLRDSLHVKNFLYAWSPDCRFTSREQYTERYPGNDYVDILGMDDYFDLYAGKSPDVAAAKLKIISDLALEQHKVAAFTETGLENVSEPDWYTHKLLKALMADQAQIAYVMVWSNRPKSYWTPYKGHPAEADFITFKNDPHILFGDKMGNVYKIR
ncbi:glycoside hydrolase family 26 protein [Mucilaginibacter sp. X4EP1]|uniref:glycoside hydrolase family 26 protein n=1 Tax=Mucilaginibacter sp. X4EP1 TaxID=2723092 RepID=UPI002169001E|nr:glycoside hydrolase family 26 protein [Mucilaginibacter sp. X4EP1]MCS3812663.1 mannan endo-1,4-beta-mannosidase [Mucilaginibacter sp. X4EP1]